MYRVGDCVVKFRAFFVAAGVVAASSFSTPVTFGSGNSADAADAGQLPAQEVVTVPEFVPILNFSQFVLATDQFGEANRARAAEMLSAKFAGTSDGQHVQLNQGPQPTPAIVESAMSSAVPDPAEKPGEAFADPVKVATAISKATETPAAPEEEATAKETETKSSARARSEKRFRPAMGLGMAVDQDDTAMQWWFSSGKPTKKSADRSQIRRVATTDGSAGGNAPNAAAARAGATPKEDFQIGIPGQSMEPQISTCATRERTCWGKFCGC